MEEIRTQKSLVGRNPRSGELQNSIAFTSWDNQEFGVVNRKVNFCQLSLAGSNQVAQLDYHGIQLPGGLFRFCLWCTPLLFNTPVRFGFFDYRVIGEFHTSGTTEVVAMVWTQFRRRTVGKPWHGAPSPLRLRGRPISLQSVMGTITLGTRFSVSLRSWWVLYLWVYDLPFLHDGGYSYSARGDTMLSFSP